LGQKMANYRQLFLWFLNISLLAKVLKFLHQIAFFNSFSSIYSTCTAHNSEKLKCTGFNPPPWVSLPVYLYSSMVGTERIFARCRTNHSPINQNFDLNKSRQNSIIAWKSIIKLVIFQSFVAKCSKMRII
jgi:hypothetical protein